MQVQTTEDVDRYLDQVRKSGIGRARLDGGADRRPARPAPAHEVRRGSATIRSTVAR